MKFICILFLLVSCIKTGNDSYQQRAFLNPILAGFYPDPSICKAGENNYYLVNSSFAYYPGIPVFHSNDLVNWQQIGNAMDRPEQMDLDGLGMSRGIFAPTIRFNKGIFYITCTLVDAGGNFIIYATDPAGPWSNPVFIPEIAHIDPSLFFDDDGRTYILYNSVAPDNKPLYPGHRSIRMMEFDIENLKVSADEIMLVNGGSDISKKPEWIEGPHIYKVNGAYYLSAGEGGTYENHSQVVFKSEQVSGPYAAYSKNPILSQRDLDPGRENPVTSTGHADFIEDSFGNWWAVFLGCRPYSEDFYNTGRETFMAPVKWMEGWPVINADYQEIQYSYPIMAMENQGGFPFNGNFTTRDNFNTKTLHYSWLFQRTVKKNWYDLAKNEGFLTITLLPDIFNDKTNPAFIGRRQQHFNGSAAVSMNFTPLSEFEKAGIAIFQNETHYYYICKSIRAGNEVVQLYKSNQADMDILAEKPIEKSGTMLLKIEAKGDVYSFLYGFEDQNYKILKDSIDAKFVSTKGAGGVTFVGSTYGMYATTVGKESDNYAQFDWFEYVGDDDIYKK